MRAYVIGAGLSGLVAAEALSRTRPVTLLEASPKAGGRCRSYRDERLGRVIDNGNHLILSANARVLAWAERIGGADGLRTGDAAFPFLDLASGDRWTIRPGRGPLGAAAAEARPPGTSLARLGLQIARALGHPGTVAQAIPDRGPLWRAFWDPMTRAVLNEDPQDGSARLLARTMLRSFARGARHSRPVLAPDGLGPALIDPALDLLAARGADLRLRTPVTALHGADRLARIETRDGPVDLGPTDVAVLATPSHHAAQLLGHDAPPAGKTIANAHFLLPDSGLPPILALLGGTSHWLFRRGDVVSVTVSAAESAGLPATREAALETLWRDVAAAARAHGAAVPDAMPTARLIKEKNATFDQSPQAIRTRTGPGTKWPNLALAGDHAATGLPATLEGAVLAGERAAARLERA
ncbi:FAD-dependent oxidoreductase [Jannaschia sp. Os4]|uniref:hydroxysqualene dehydroxylase HpnE n=1 Tax=Jannaschia sp. Os4 TaxID=2807617 RepID=UPI00193A2C6D|nr:FAD-dependent oxidoreductase [Jannaschia sp. Os4]